MDQPLDVLAFPVEAETPVEHLSKALAMLAPYYGYRIGFNDGSALDVEAVRRRVEAALFLLERQ